MSHPSPLEYASPPDDRTRRDRAVLLLSAVGAMALATYVCFHVAITIYGFASEPALFRGIDLSGVFALVALAGGPMLVACVLLLIAASRHIERAPRAAACAAITGVFLLAITIIQIVLTWVERVSTSPGEWRFVFGQLATCAGYLCLVVPLSILRAQGPGARRGRLLAISGAAMLLAGLPGMHVLANKALTKQAVIGGTYSQAMQVVLREPAPFVGLWPAAGIAAGALFLIAIVQPRLPLLGFAILLAVTFQVTLVVSQYGFFIGPTGNTWGRLMRVELYIRALRDTVSNLVPAAIVARALWRDRESFLPEPVTLLPHPD